VTMQSAQTATLVARVAIVFFMAFQPSAARKAGEPT